MTNAVRMARRPNRKREREAARVFLGALLRHGPVPVAEVRAKARAAGIPQLYLRQAKQVLRVELVKSGFGRDGWWSWQLPSA
jgi:hypothetical protein